MKNRVYLFGAGDRFNYGDLLFPHILVAALKVNIGANISFGNYGLVRSNLKKSGALTTRSIRQLYSDLSESNDNNTIVIVGGEVLGPNWSDLLNCSNSLFNRIAASKYFSYFLNLNNIAKLILRGRTEYAYILKRDLFESKIIYNAVGGIRLPYHDSQQIGKIILNLNDADYISVRDSFTYGQLKLLGLENCKLVPDCAVLMSDLYDQDFLKSKVIKKNFSKMHFLENNDFLFFQVNKPYGKKYLNQIVDLLNDIHHNYNLTIVLCPIGKALSHEDDFALKEISHRLRVPFVLFKNVNIWEIMYLISKARIFIGTSLHGIITAMSFNVPYFGVFEENRKINEYLKTWGVEGLNRCHSIRETNQKVGAVMNIPKEEFIKNKEMQILKVKESMDSIRRILINS